MIVLGTPVRRPSTRWLVVGAVSVIIVIDALRTIKTLSIFGVPVNPDALAVGFSALFVGISAAECGVTLREHGWRAFWIMLPAGVGVYAAIHAVLKLLG